MPEQHTGTGFHLMDAGVRPEPVGGNAYFITRQTNPVEMQLAGRRQSPVMPERHSQGRLAKQPTAA